MSKKEFAGINVTIPYKEKVLPIWMKYILWQANRAVNTIVNNQGRLTGYNTDFTVYYTL